MTHSFPTILPRRRRTCLKVWATVLTLLMVLSGTSLAQDRLIRSRRDSRAGVQQLEFGSGQQVALAGGKSHLYVINTLAGHYYRVAVEQQGIDLELTLLSASGETLSDVDNANGTRGNETVSFISKVGENYRIKVRAKEPKPKPAAYTITIPAFRLSTEDDVKCITAERALAIGESLRIQGAYNKALAKYDEAYGLSKGLDRLGAATALLDAGKAYYFMSNMEDAARKYEEALKIFEELQLSLEQGVALVNIGMVKLYLGQSTAAVDYYQRALELFTQEKDERYASLALNEIGRAFYLRGHINRALEYYSQALPIREALNDRKGESFTLVSIGRAYVFDLGNETRALELYERALKLQREINNRRLIAMTLGDIGQLYYKTGEYEKAITYYNEALRTVESTDPSVKAEILMYIGMVYSAWGRHREAVGEYFAEALRLQEGRDVLGEARTLQYIGRSYTELGDDKNALDYLNRALAIWKRVNYATAEAETRYNLAVIKSRQGQLSEACEEIKTALPVVETLRTGIGNRALRAYYFATVQNYYELYIDALMRLFQQTGDKRFETLALNVSESKRARALVDVLIESKADTRSIAGASELLNKETSIQQELSTLSFKQVRGEHLSPEQGRRLYSLITELHDLDAQIRQKTPGYAALTRPVPPSLEEIQNRLLAQDQLLLEYSLGDERSFLWAVNNTLIKSYVLPKRKEIEAVVLKFIKSLTARNDLISGESAAARELRIKKADAECITLATSLGTMLGLDRVASDFQSQRLLIVGDGELQYLPFAALLIPPDHRRTSALPMKTREYGDKLVPLLAYFEIEEPPAMSVVAELRRRHKAGTAQPNKTIAVIADPVFSRNDVRCCRLAVARKNVSRNSPAVTVGPPFDVLKENRAKVREAGIIDGRGEFVRLGLSASEANVILDLVRSPEERLRADGFDANVGLLTKTEKLSNYRILHFATHGLLNSEHPELSGLLLSMIDEQGRAQNGFFQMHQILRLHLPAELVVLSACETAIGLKLRGEGLNGISRGFMYAGARRVVASLWKVNDASTSELMKEFYRHLGVGERRDFNHKRPAAALREAQLELITPSGVFRNPYFWAGFIIQGENG